MANKLVVATGNPGKLKEMQEYLQDLPWQLELKPRDLEVDETGSTFKENACLKAQTVAKVLGSWAIADDSGLAVKALKGAPGLYSARYGNTDAERITRLLKELAGATDRTAEFICAVVIANPQGEIVLETEGVCPGEILTESQGDGGFGYDPVFYVPAQGATFAQMSAETKRKISHRGVAFAQLLPELRQLSNQI